MSVEQFPPRHHANADICPGCGALARLFVFGRCQKCVETDREEAAGATGKEAGDGE